MLGRNAILMNYARYYVYPKELSIKSRRTISKGELGAFIARNAILLLSRLK
jgi:hypothetical protein